MNQIFSYYKLIIAILFANLLINKTFAVTTPDSIFLFFPKSFANGDFQSSLGISVTRLPMQVVEEEISYSPTLNYDFRYGISNNFSLNGSLISNYITNKLQIGSTWSNFYKKLQYCIGIFTSGWYSHLDVDAIKLNTYGITLTPRISVGYNLFNILTTVQLESQHHIFWNYLEKEYLGSTKIFDGGFSMNVITEQPFVGKMNTIIALKFHYVKFHYQSWLAYSVIDEYLFYPEFYFGVKL